MMDKILIYTNSWDEVKRIASFHNKLKAEGFEVAYATDVLDIAVFLNIKKLLVVKFGTYFADFYVSTTKLPKVKTISFDELEGLI